MKTAILILSFLLITPILSAQNYSGKQQKQCSQALCISGVSLITASAITFNKSTEPKVNVGIATIGLITASMGVIVLRRSKYTTLFIVSHNKTITPGVKIRF